MAEKGYALAPPPPTLSLGRRGSFFAPACAFAATMLGTTLVYALYRSELGLGQIPGIDNRATVGLLVFAVFAVSTFGETLLERAFGVRALVASSVGLIAGMGLLAFGLALSSLPFLLAGGVVAGLGQGVSFRHGLAAINDASGERRREAAAGDVVIASEAMSREDRFALGDREFRK